MEEKMNPETRGIAVEELDQVSGGARDYVIYTVQHGDNLHKIADKFGIGWRDIYKLNKRTIGDDPMLIYAGQQLKIPQ